MWLLLRNGVRLRRLARKVYLTICRLAVKGFEEAPPSNSVLDSYATPAIRPDYSSKFKGYNDGIRVEGLRIDVCQNLSNLIHWLTNHRYNRYLAIAARVVRRSLKEGERLKAERRGDMELKFAKWEVCLTWAVENTLERN